MKISGKKVNVSLVKPVLKNIKKALIPASVKIKGINCKVTAIGDKAFANCKKLRKVVIGNNINSIGKKSFYGTKSLRSVIVKSKVIKKVAKNSFANTGNKVKYQFPKKKARSYKKMF